jgi:hypothetical protein
MTKESDKCLCCPECGCKSFTNKDEGGDGFRVCSQCGQDWWTDIKYKMNFYQTKR